MATGAAHGFRQLRGGDEAHPLDPLDDELGDAVTRVQLDGLAQVGVVQRDADLAAVPGVDGARRVERGETTLGGESERGTTKAA